MSSDDCSWKDYAYNKTYERRKWEMYVESQRK